MGSGTYSLLVLLVDLAAKTFLVVDLVLQAERIVLKAVPGLNALAGSLVLLGILLSLFNHAVNLLLSETALIVGDSDGLSLASALVVGRHLEDTVGVKLKGNLNLGHATGRGGNVGQLKLAEYVVVLGHGALAFEDLDQDDRLVIGSSREDLALASRDGSVTGDQLGHDTTGGLDTKSKRVDIHEDDVAGTLLTGEHTSLNSGAESDSLIRVNALGGLLATEELLEELLNLGDTS